MRLFVMTLLLIFTFSTQAQLTEDAFAQEIKKTNVIYQLEQVAAGTLKKNQYERFQLVMERLVTLRPQNTHYQFSLAKSYALLGKKSEAYNTLVKLQNAGFSYPILGNEAFNKVSGTKVYDYIDEGMVNNGKPYGTGESVAQVPEQYAGMLFENMAYDVKGNRFLLGSIRSGEVYALTSAGTFKAIIQPQSGDNETYGVIDLVVDETNDMLWVATASMPQYNGSNQNNFGKATISKYQLSSGKWLSNINTESLTKPLLFNALHITQKGDLYFINPFTREVMTVAANNGQIKPFLNLAQFASVKAITSNDDASVIYFSDYDQGLFIVNVASKNIKSLNDPSKSFLSGIDDLFYSQGDLVAIQNQTSPSRVVRVLLEQDVFFQGLVPVQSNHPKATAMTKGFVKGDEVYFFGNSQWNKMDMNGNLQQDKQWDAIDILKVDSKYKLTEHLETQQRMADIKKKRGIN